MPPLAIAAAFSSAFIHASWNAALKGGSTPAGERTILETWRDYYLSALGSMPDMSLSNDGLTSEIAAARAKVSGVASELLGALPR